MQTTIKSSADSVIANPISKLDNANAQPVATSTTASSQPPSVEYSEGMRTRLTQLANEATNWQQFHSLLRF